VIKTAGDLGTIDIFLNFPIHDINRTVLVKDPSEMDPRQVRRMDAFWGDNSWREVAYATDANLQRVAMILTHANHSFVNACRASPSKRFCVADCEAGQLHCKPLKDVMRDLYLLTGRSSQFRTMLQREQA
jgi:hypothetical protein